MEKLKVKKNTSGGKAINIFPNVNFVSYGANLLT